MMSDPQPDHAASLSSLRAASAIPLVGRNAALKALLLRLEQAQQGWGGKVAVMAESGVGKTRIAHELAHHARQADMTTISLPCRGTTLRPYQPMVDLARLLLDIPVELPAGEQHARLAAACTTLGLRDFEQTLAELLGLAARHPAASPGSPLEADADATVHDLPDRETDLAEVLRLMLQGEAARGSGLLIILDDLDEAAELTRSTMLRLMEGLDRAPVLLLAAFRPDASEELKGAFGSAIVPLSMLSREDTLEMGASVLGLTWLSTELGEIVWKHTGGRPLLIEMLVTSLNEAGRIAVRPEDRLGSLTGEGTIPSLREIVIDRIRRLPPEYLKTLLNAVVLGDGFRTGALGVLHENRSEADLLADLEGLVQARLLERTGEGRRAIYRFPNALVRDTLYETAPPERRTAMHLRAGEYYAVPAGGRPIRTESAVYHFLRAGRPDRAMGVIDTAIQRAQDESDMERVIALHREGLQVAARDPALRDRQTRLASALGDLYVRRRDYRGAALAYRQADLEQSDLSLQARLALALLALDPSAAVGMLSRLAPAIPPDYPDDLRWRVEAGLAWGLALTGQTYEAVRRSRDSLGTLSSAAGFGSARTLMRGTLGMALYYHGDQAEASPHLESARAGYGARGDEQGVLFINQVLIGTPRADIVSAWLDLVLSRLVRSGPARG